jgi:hypothetical protein
VVAALQYDLCQLHLFQVLSLLRLAPVLIHLAHLQVPQREAMVLQVPARLAEPAALDQVAQLILMVLLVWAAVLIVDRPVDHQRLVAAEEVDHFPLVQAVRAVIMVVAGGPVLLPLVQALQVHPVSLLLRSSINESFNFPTRNAH